MLVQHLVTVALGGGFIPDELRAEVATTFAYRDLTSDEWQWALNFVRHGGSSLNAYPDYHRVLPDEHGEWRVPDVQLARRHRMSIGTIVSDASMAVKFWSKGRGGKTLGSVEEGFIARLKPGDYFLFGGRLLELVRVHEMTAFVRPASGKKPAVPSWNGGRMPLSTELSNAIVTRMDAAAHGHFDGPEMQLVKPLLEVQMKWSALPTQHTLLAETLRTREGWHLFLYPYAGRNVHLGLASLLAWRIGKHQPNTFSIAVNDYGFELLSATELEWERRLTPEMFSTDHLLEDVLGSLNASELAQRRFREIARISGLVFTGYPGVPKSARQVQASSSLFYDVFRKYDPDNPLLTQAQQEVLRQELDVERLSATLVQMTNKTLHWQRIERPTPFAFPLLVERFRESSSSENCPTASPAWWPTWKKPQARVATNRRIMSRSSAPSTLQNRSAHAAIENAKMAVRASVIRDRDTDCETGTGIEDRRPHAAATRRQGDLLAAAEIAAHRRSAFRQGCGVSRAGTARAARHHGDQPVAVGCAARASSHHALDFPRRFPTRAEIPRARHLGRVARMATTPRPARLHADSRQP